MAMTKDFCVGATLYDGRTVDIMFSLSDEVTHFIAHRMWVEPSYPDVVFTTQDFWERVKPCDFVVRRELEEE